MQSAGFLRNRQKCLMEGIHCVVNPFYGIERFKIVMSERRWNYEKNHAGFMYDIGCNRNLGR